MSQNNTKTSVSYFHLKKKIHERDVHRLIMHLLCGKAQCILYPNPCSYLLFERFHTFILCFGKFQIFILLDNWLLIIISHKYVFFFFNVMF